MASFSCRFLYNREDDRIVRELDLREKPFCVGNMEHLGLPDKINMKT
jgi:hypothetical protein